MKLAPAAFIIVLVTVALVVLGSLSGCITLAIQGKEIPSFLVTLLSSAATALVGLLTVPHNDSN
jgi:fatty acid desaturase